MSHRPLLLGHCTEKIHFAPFFCLLQLPKCEEFKGFFLRVREEISQRFKVFCFLFQIIRGNVFLLLSVPLES